VTQDRDRGRCRACPAPVKWVIMASGKRNPLDREPDPERGNVIIVDSDELAAALDVPLGRAVALGGARLKRARETPGRDLYISHFATCPARQQFRQR
jgi:hypothetical protein